MWQRVGDPALKDYHKLVVFKVIGMSGANVRSCGKLPTEDLHNL
jgi:hypothetical protein